MFVWSPEDATIILFIAFLSSQQHAAHVYMWQDFTWMVGSLTRPDTLAFLKTLHY